MSVVPVSLQDTRVTMEFDTDQFDNYTKKLLSLYNAQHEIKLTVTLSVLPFHFFCTIQICNNL